LLTWLLKKQASTGREVSNMCTACGCGLKDKKDPAYGKGPAKKAPAKKAAPKKKK